MKRILSVFLVLFVLCSCSSNIKYPITRDTHELFGDGRFVIIDSYGDTQYCLFDEKNKRAVENDVICYKSVNCCVYTIGISGMYPKTRYGVTDSMGNVIWDSVEENTYYTKVNFETGSIYQYTDLSKYGKEDQKVFAQLEQDAKQE